MPDNLEEVIRKNKQYLTQAQINALAEASRNYSAQNAGARAGALSSAREQYDTAYRGLQNMGLAGNQSAAPASGEVPRLRMQIQTPFDAYNDRIKQVENRRLNALGGAFAQQTIAQREAEAAAARAAAEQARQRAEAQRQAAAAAQAARAAAQAEIQRATAAARAINMKSLPSAPKLKTADLTTPSVKEFDTVNPSVAAANKYQQDGYNRTKQVQAAAAASLYNITSAVNAAQERGAKLTAQLKGTANASTPDKLYVDESGNAQKVALEKAQAAYKEASDAVENLKWKQHYGDTVSKEEYQSAIDRRDLAKDIAEKPELTQAFSARSSASVQERQKANRVIGSYFGDKVAQSLGYSAPTMSDAEFSRKGKDVPEVRRILRVIDAERNRPEVERGVDIDQDTIDEELGELRKLGYTEQEARSMLETFEHDRQSRRDYPVIQKAYAAYYEHDGEKPNSRVNIKEADPTYRAVNNLPDLRVQSYNDSMMENPQLGPMEKLWTPQERAHGDVDYMTDEQRDAYNAIYEAEGVDAANQYAEDIKPLIEMERARKDKEYLEQLATEHGWQAWALARATNLVASIPAMAEKLYVGVSNQIQNDLSGGTNVPMRYSPDSYLSRASNWADIIQSKQSQNILEKYDKQGKEGLGRVVNFLYQTGTSMADSAVAMLVSGVAGSWATDLLFFSSAGNQAYKDAIERGGDQNQAMASGILSGIAEALFEHVSIEHFMNMDYKGKGAFLKNMLSQGVVEGSEETFTEIANILTDAWTMKDKSQFNQLKEQYGEKGAYLELLKNVGMATLGGMASGLGFGVIGAVGNAPSAIRSKKQVSDIGKSVREYGDLQQVHDTGILLGGDAMAAAEKAQLRETNTNVGNLTLAVQQEIQQLGAESLDQQVAVQRVLDGAKMTTKEASDVVGVLGAETVAKLGYDASTPEAFAASYNQRVEKAGITSRAERMAQSAAKKFARARQSAANRVWANPEQGLSYTTQDGNKITPMPGNMTAVALAEQERTGFQTRSTATRGNATYAISGMQVREGLTNDQAYDEIQKGFTKDAQRKAKLYESLADALGVKMVIHDVMVGTNGFIDEKGNMHVVLSGKQSVLRVAAHELTHWMKEKNAAGYASMRQHLIAEVGQERFDRMMKQKAKEYGLNLDNKSDRVVADDEVCAELCERMLSNEKALERFAEKDTNAARTLKEHLHKILDAIKSAFKRAENRDFGDSWSDLIKSQDTIESWISELQKAVENAETRAKTNEGQIAQTAGVTTSDQQEMLDEIKDAKTDAEVDDAISEHSVDVIEYDMVGYMQDLEDAQVMTRTELSELMDTMNAAIDKVKAHRAILDYGAELNTEEEILAAKKNRAYLPYKQNADPHYKLALDFSTLCRKRVLLQTIQERLQAKLGRALSQEETVSIRLALQKLQREGYKVEVACALCYVEAARLKSPKVINAFLNNTANEMRNYFAKKNPASKKIVEGMQQQWKVEHGYAPDAKKDAMTNADKNSFNNYSRDLREQFEGSANEAAIVARAIDLVKNHREVFLSASELTKLKKSDPDIFNAFTEKVRSATRSKAQETDTFYSRGDIDMVTEAILKYANAESGFRHQSWSDFVPTHLLDTMAAVIEMSTKKAKMHAYTKVPAMVRLLGKTGMALNMSLIPSGNTGIDANGNLAFDSVEGMPWETMLQLRDMFPDTAGNIAIGINGEQIQKLLASKDIDYVIPYHASGMNKNMRGYLDIRAWSEYTSSQNEKSNHRGPKGAAPELAEWFDEKAAANATDGEAFMREASEKYLQLCYERNLVPKFSQYLTNNGDGSYSLKEGYENYWKMLTDRKMVNQKTGKVIIQQAVKPTFDQATVIGILEDRLNDPAIQDAAEAADIVTEQFSDWQANRNNASPEAIQAAKDIRDRTAAITAQKTAEADGVRHMADGTNLTEREMENYVDFVENALKGKGYNKRSSIRIGRVAPAIIEGLKRFGIYLNTDAYHELSDNNVRHLRDSKQHGIEHEGPRGITDGDVYAIPYILANADAAYFRTSKKGEIGVLYVMNDNDSTYYVEGIPSNGVLSGRQMIKAPRGMIPSEYVNDVKKEKALTASPDDLRIPGAYVQDATRSRAFEDIIPSILGGRNTSIRDSLDVDSQRNTALEAAESNNSELQKLGVATTAMHSIDTEYMEEARKYTGKDTPDTVTKKLQGMVERAARKAGYNSPKLYHGTQAFGFTRFDLSKGNGLIFASSNMDTSRTYSGETERSTVSERSTINAEELHGQDLIDAANQHLANRYDGFELLTGQQKESYAQRIRDRIGAVTVENAAQFLNDNAGAFDAEKMSIMRGTISALSEIGSARSEDDLAKAWKKWDDAIWDLKGLDDSIAMEFLKAVNSRDLERLRSNLNTLLYTGDLYGYDTGYGLSYVYDNQIVLELEAELNKGVYSLYGRLGKNLEIDAEGSYWDEIQAPEELHLSGLQRTRAIAEKAFSLGYDSVTIKNLRDNGGQTNYRGDGDIYIFNAQNAVKSADPVTYGDDGAVIPLSDRFNTESDDIRYDLDTDVLREIQTPTIEEQVWDANGIARYSVDTKRAQKREPGMKPAGREPRARDVQVPERAKNGNRVSDFTRSFLESDKATDDMVAELQQKIADGEWGSYEQLTNQDAMDRAKDFISRRQITQAQQEFHDMVTSGKYNVNTRAIGLQLLTEAAARGDKIAVLDIASDLRVLATDAGQSVQIFSTLKDLGGVGSAWYMQKVVDRLNEKYADQIAAGKMDTIALDEELVQQLIEAKTTKEVTAAEKAISKNLADQLPLTWADRLSNWRYLAMLGNPTTHVRNMFGNLLMAGLNKSKDVVAVGVQRTAEKLGVTSASDRAHAVLTSADRRTWSDFAQQSYEEQEENLRGGGKLGFETFVQQNMRSFDTKWLNAISQFNFDALEKEDIAFIRPAYRNALMEYMKAQGYSLQDGVAGKMVGGEFKEISKAEMNKAVEWASSQAWKATFRDASALATMLNKISKMNTVSRLVVEGVMPFKKTPINIAKRGVEYSPVGIVMGTVQLMHDVKKGKVTAAQAIDNLASGITGTALMALGMFLAKAGLIRAGGDDKKKKETYLQDTGEQTYSLKIGKLSFNLSSVAPATIPLFMGVALQEMLSKNGGDFDLSVLTDTVAGTLNPLMEMSFMSSLNSALKNYGSEGIGGALGNTLLTSAENYFSQYLPTVVAKAGQFADPTVRTTKSSATSPIGSGMDYYLRSLVKKVPGAEATLQPDIDVWGRKTVKDSFLAWGIDFANKFVLPFNVKVSKKDAVDNELIRLVESTGGVDFLPSDGAKKFTVSGQDFPMSAKQYAEFSQDRGQASYAALKEVMRSDAYINASDEEKAAMLEKALSAAQKQVNTTWKEKLGALDVTVEPEKENDIKSMKGDYSDPELYNIAAQYPNAYDKAAKAKSKGVTPATFLDLYDKKENYIGDNRSDYVRQEIMNSNLSKQQKELMDDLIVSDKGDNPDYSSPAWFRVSMLGKGQYNEAKQGEKIGLKPETYLQVYSKWKTLDAKDENGKTVNGLKKKRAKEYLDGLTVSAPVYDYIWHNIFGY